MMPSNISASIRHDSIECPAIGCTVGAARMPASRRRGLVGTDLWPKEVPVTGLHPAFDSAPTYSVFATAYGFLSAYASRLRQHPILVDASNYRRGLLSEECLLT
jgi:hypothetical protein